MAAAGSAGKSIKEGESKHLKQPELKEGGGGTFGWQNTGQEKSILLTVKIHLVRTKHPKRT